VRYDIERSGVALERLWQAFQARHRANFPDAKPPTKRQVSGWLGTDTHSVARWTNDAAHSGKHAEWRIPLRRIPEVCHALEASADDEDALMFARLQEAQDSEEKTDVLVVMRWLEPTITALVKRPEVDAFERQVLEAFNRARAANVAANHIPFGKDRDDELENFLRAWLDDVVNDYLAEQHVESDEGPAVQFPVMNEKVRKAIAGSAKRIRAAPMKPPSKRQMQDALRRFRAARRDERTSSTSSADAPTS
jgi:hypothetical protein